MYAVHQHNFIIAIIACTSNYVIVKAPLRVHYGNYSTRGVVETSHTASAVWLVETTPRVL